MQAAVLITFSGQHQPYKPMLSPTAAVKTGLSDYDTSRAEATAMENAAAPAAAAAAPAARHAAATNSSPACSKQQNKTADVCPKLVSQISEAARPHFIFADRQLWILNCSSNGRNSSLQ
jgi:cell pole-organizing protein PopZ